MHQGPDIDLQFLNLNTGHQTCNYHWISAHPTSSK